MALFLVRGTVERTLREGVATHSVETRLVDADDEFRAASKFDSHFDRRSSEAVGISYMTYDVFAHPVIT
jgi:hypothetical protein